MKVLMDAGYKVISIDNYCNSKAESLKRVGNMFQNVIYEVDGDLRDPESYHRVFQIFTPVCVFHLAGLKAVGESVSNPLQYYENNLLGTLRLLETMEKHNCRTMVFSSSATVYAPSEEKLTETSPLAPSNPYGQTKFMLEQMLKDLQKADPRWSITSLRYFNPIGAHPSGLIGEHPTGTPNNLLPYITQVLVGKRESLTVFGNDYGTADGTGVRDYIHVMDLAEAHLVAYEKLAEKKTGSYNVYNIGTGDGNSVLEMVKAMELVSKKSVRFVIADRRAGDIGYCVASPEKARQELGWSAKRDLRTMCEDAWRWQRMNPNGYK